MRTIQTTLYQFNELSEQAQQIAIENERNSEYNIYLDFFYDYCIEQIKEKGFNGNIELQYSLNYNQGDGLSFSAKYYDNLKDIFISILGDKKQKTIDLILENCILEIKGNRGHYYYASRKDINLELNNYYLKSTTNLDILISKVETKLTDIYIELCKQLQNEGYSEIEYQNSDEYIKEFLINNQIEFTEYGSRQ